MSAAREPIVSELAAALDDVLEKTTWEGKGKHIAPALLAALGSRELVLVERSSLRAPQGGRDYKALAEAYLDERVLVETMPRKRPDLVRDFAKWLAGSGAETPPQPEIPK